MRSYTMSYDVFKRSFTLSNENRVRRSEKTKIKNTQTNDEKLKTGEKENKGEG